MPSPVSDTALDPLYYLANFDRVIGCIASQHRDLLHPDDIAFIDTYCSQPQSARQLYVRLICRRARHFIAATLNYPEINALPQAALTLERAGLLQINGALPATEIASLLNAPTLRRILALPSNTRKAALTTALIERYGADALEYPIWRDWIGSEVYSPLGERSVIRCCLIYFGNLHQDLSQFVVSDLGIQRYEPYRLDPDTRPFTTCAEVDLYLQLSALQEALTEHRTVPVDTEWLTRRASCHATERKRNQLIHMLGRDLERDGQQDAALALYRSATLPPNRERAVRLLYAEARYDDAETHCLHLAEHPLDRTERRFCQQFLPRIRRKLGGPPVKATAAALNTLTLALIDNGERVEQQVLEHFSAQGFKGVWCENDLFCALFGLLFWEVVFAPVPGAFSHPFQRAPLDFHHPGFSQRRKALFDARLKALSKLDLWHEAYPQFVAKEGIQNPFIRWSRVTTEALEALCQRIPQSALLALMAQIAFDPCASRSGFPDLFIWHAARDEYRLIEVKGPGDKLQPAQTHWLTLFDQLGLDYVVCHVTRPNQAV